VLVDGAEVAQPESFRRLLDVFDGGEASLEAARERWRRAKAAGHELTYWQQTEQGWERKG
jgi:DNA polymerase-3 subunit chi